MKDKSNKDISEKDLDKLSTNDEQLSRRMLVSKMLDASEVKLPEKGKSP